MVKQKNKIFQKLKFEKNSVFPNNENNKKYACCIVIPFGCFNFNKKDNQLNKCRQNNLNWRFDEIMINEEDYKELIKKSEYVKILANI